MRGETIVGHTNNNKGDNNFTIIVIVVLVIIGFFVLRFVEQKSSEPSNPKPSATATSVASVQPSPLPTEKPVMPNNEIISKPFGIKVVEKSTSRNIISNRPDEISDKFTSGEKVYFYSQISSDKIPLPVTHVWINPNGETYYAIDLYARKTPTSDLWSYVVIPAGTEGEWTVHAVAGGKVVDSKSFLVE